MKNKLKITLKCALSILIILSIAGWGPFSFLKSLFSSQEPENSAAWLGQQIETINSQASNINQTVLKLGLMAYLKAREQGLNQKQMLTIIDYSKPSSERRLWVVDLKKGKVLFNTWVSHGKNSGTAKATSFSNQTGSLKSSLGLFLTTNEPYQGGNGYSLRLVGLERGVNDNAYRRNVVIHGAWYADSDVAQKHGQLGRSWGCPAVPEKLAKPLIDTIKEKSLVFAYYPDHNWLQNSTFLAT